MTAVGKLKSVALNAIRSRGREIAWAPEWMNLGNLLYLGLWAYEGQQIGADRYVLLHPRHERTMGMFPTARDQLFLPTSEVRFTDQRLTPWRGFKPEPKPYAPTQLRAYIQDALLPGSPLQERPAFSGDTMVVNVRRGDYYSVPQHEAEFGMDQVAYIRDALGAALAERGAPQQVVVISDGLDWCRNNLDSMLTEVAPVTYEDGDVLHDLRAIVHARRLIMTNSTFSYWGGYIGDVLHPGRQVVAPRLFSRHLNGGRAHQLRAHWTVIDGDY